MTGAGAPPGAGGAPGGLGTSPLPASASPPPPARPRRGAARWLVICLVLVLGLAGIAGGGLALTRELGRGPTHAEVAAALRQEIAGRWQHLPAGKIFPAAITYQTAEAVNAKARLVGIARHAGPDSTRPPRPGSARAAASCCEPPT